MPAGYAVPLRLTVKQEQYCRRAIGTARFIYNLCAATHSFCRTNRMDWAAWQDLYKAFNAAKGEDYPFATEVASRVQEGAFRDSGAALRNRRDPSHQAGPPRFRKKRRTGADSFRAASGVATLRPLCAPGVSNAKGPVCGGITERVLRLSNLSVSRHPLSQTFGEQTRHLVCEPRRISVAPPHLLVSLRRYFRRLLVWPRRLAQRRQFCISGARVASFGLSQTAVSRLAQLSLNAAVDSGAYQFHSAEDGHHCAVSTAPSSCLLTCTRLTPPSAGSDKTATLRSATPTSATDRNCESLPLAH